MADYNTPSKIPEEFRKSPAVIASYDWLDLTSGVGYRRYYAGISGLTGGTGSYLKILSGNVFESDPWFASASRNDAGYYEWDVGDFDITFNVPAIVAAAKATVNVLLYMNNNTGTSYVTINVYHVNAAAAETLIGTATSRTFTSGGAAYYRAFIAATLTEKKFAIGEKLRLNILYYLTTGAAGACTFKIFYDPASRETYDEVNGATSGTDFTCDIPFKINI